jgi:transcriptional regulator with XRE-family HTH domain
MTTQVSSLGKRLRSLRKERSLTQRNLAQQAGISVNAVSLIERNEISPSVTTLQSLAGALKVRVSYFFDDDTSAKTIFLAGKDMQAISSKGLTIETLGHRLTGQQMEPFLITLEPGAESGQQPVMHSGEEFVYCLQGVMEYNVEGTVYHLNEGDVLMFEASQPHHWRNPSAQVAKVLVMLQSFDESNDSIRRHFPAYPSLTHLDQSNNT